ncbi:LysE family transporter, partial [Paraburkholderia sp. SIMBA_009]
LCNSLLNPKALLFFMVFLPQFVRPEHGSIAVQILVLATVLNLIGLVVNGAVILSASRLSQRIGARRRPSKLPQYLLGTVFVGLAARLAVAGRS